MAVGIFLQKFEVEGYRDIDRYSIDCLSKMVAITGPNSTKKSTLVSALGILGSNRTHDYQDVPAKIVDNDNARNAVVHLSYFFELIGSFYDLLSDKRLIGFLIEMKKKQISKLKTAKDKILLDYEKTVKYQIQRLKAKRFADPLYAALYETLKKFRGDGTSKGHYSSFLDEFGNLRNPYEVLNSAKYIKITLDMSIADEPSYKLEILDSEKREIVSPRLLFWWLETAGLVDELELVTAIGAVFVKCLVSLPFYPEESAIPSTVLSADSSNLEAFVSHVLEHEPELIERASKNFCRLFSTNIKIKKPDAGFPSETTKLLVRLETTDQWFPLERLADGMLSAFKILLQLSSCKDGDLLVIDEPELHLHPGAIKTLREIFNEEKSRIQIIYSTHSPILIDPSFVDMIVLHYPREKPKVIDSSQIKEVMISLGSSGSDALLYDIVIWYEGPSDKVYIEKWLKLYSSEIKGDQANIGLMHFGGASVLQHIDTKAVKKIASNSIFVIDSDRVAEKNALHGKVKSFVDKCHADGIYCWATVRREIENYIPLKILRGISNNDTLSVGHYDDVLEKINKGDDYKVKLATQSTKLMTLELMQEDKEFDKEFKEELIQKINSF